MPFHPTGEASRMYSKYDEAQFHLRLPHELHAKIKQRAKMNNRSLNSEIIAAIEESLAKQSSASVYIDDAERMWICPYISRHLLSLNPLQARCRRYSRGER